MAFDEPRIGEFFKPKDNQGAYAILIEVKSIKPKSPGYKGELKDAVYADLTVFSTEADLLGNPKVYRNARVDAPLLQRELAQDVGVDNETIRQIGTWQGDRNPKPSWVWKYTDEPTRNAVIAWYDAREAAIEASLNETPDWAK